MLIDLTTWLYKKFKVYRVKFATNQKIIGKLGNIFVKYTEVKDQDKNHKWLISIRKDAVSLLIKDRKIKSMRWWFFVVIIKNLNASEHKMLVMIGGDRHSHTLLVEL